MAIVLHASIMPFESRLANALEGLALAGELFFSFGVMARISMASVDSSSTANPSGSNLAELSAFEFLVFSFNVPFLALWVFSVIDAAFFSSEGTMYINDVIMRRERTIEMERLQQLVALEVSSADKQASGEHSRSLNKKSFSLKETELAVVSEHVDNKFLIINPMAIVDSPAVATAVSQVELTIDKFDANGSRKDRRRKKDKKRKRSKDVVRGGVEEVHEALSISKEPTYLRPLQTSALHTRLRGIYDPASSWEVWRDAVGADYFSDAANIYSSVYEYDLAAIICQARIRGAAVRRRLGRLQNWQKAIDENGEIFFFNNETGEECLRIPDLLVSASKNALVLPPGWVVLSDEEGNTYYENEMNGVTQWDFPTALL
jgi:hypothetical protein